MNYYPFYNMSGVPYYSIPKKGIFTRLFGNLNINKLINGTQKTITFVNQTIPMVKQVSPFIKNTKTMFKVMQEFKKSDNNQNTKESIKTITETKKVVPNLSTTNDNSPTFFI